MRQKRKTAKKSTLQISQAPFTWEPPKTARVVKAKKWETFLKNVSAFALLLSAINTFWLISIGVETRKTIHRESIAKRVAQLFRVTDLASLEGSFSAQIDMEPIRPRSPNRNAAMQLRIDIMNSLADQAGFHLPLGLFAEGRSKDVTNTAQLLEANLFFAVDTQSGTRTSSLTFECFWLERLDSLITSEQKALSPETQGEFVQPISKTIPAINALIKKSMDELNGGSPSVARDSIQKLWKSVVDNPIPPKTGTADSKKLSDELGKFGGRCSILKSQLLKSVLKDVMEGNAEMDSLDMRQ